MKKIFFAVVFMILFLISTTAFADSAYNWKGLYVGLQGMYGHGDTKWEFADGTGQRYDHTINGWMGGLFLGYNYQFPINVVVGVETDINYGKISGSSTVPDNFLSSSELNWVGSTRIRAGYAVWRFLPYVGLGVAYGRARIYTTNIATGIDCGETNTYIGWTPSAGLEFAITKNLLARAEYAYYDLGKKQSLVDSAIPIDSTIAFQGLKFGLMWKFGCPKEASQPIAKAVAAEPPPPVQETKKAPEAEATVEQKIIEKGRVELKVEFDHDKSIVKPQYNGNIEEVADVMKKYPDLKIVIEGHTDNVGTEKYNIGLSQRRAEAIKQVMVKKFNIDAKRIKTKGFGYSKFIGDNKTKAGRQSNRRVEAAVEYTVKK